jgi:hypothetical protein
MKKFFEKPGHTVLGHAWAHGFGLLARPNRGYGSRHGASRAPIALATRSPRAVVR